MADTVKKTKATAMAAAKATATPRKASTNNVKVAEVTTPTTPDRKGIELVGKVEELKKAKATSAKPIKTETKKESVVAISKPYVVSRATIEKVAHQIWIQRGYQHGHALEDWITAERVLLERAS